MQIINPKECIHTDHHKYRVRYYTGLDHRPESIFILCQKCYDKPHFSNIENIISMEILN